MYLFQIKNELGGESTVLSSWPHFNIESSQRVKVRINNLVLAIEPRDNLSLNQSFRLESFMIGTIGAGFVSREATK